MARLHVFFIVALVLVRNIQITAQRYTAGIPVFLKTIPEHNQRAVEGSPTEIVCKDHGQGRVDVHWTRGGDLPLPLDFKQTGGHLTIPVVQLSHQGSYICAPIYSPHGETPQQSVYLHVRRKDECMIDNEWSACDHSCTKTRVCHLKPVNYTSNEDCDEKDCDEHQIVSLMQSEHCPDCQVGGWGDWSDWTICSQSCGGGNRTRNRRCDNPTPRGGGSTCDGLATLYEGCNTFSCPVHCAWSEWSAWNECSVSCGRGTRKRFRNERVYARHGGRDCDGLETQSEDCDALPCPYWSAWTLWGPCSSTCGSGGYQRRTRECFDDQRRPGRSNPHCEGVSYQDQRCSALRLCPTDGNWSPWEDWSACSLSCGGGSRYRRRSCNNPRPSPGGAWCPGKDAEDEPCNVEKCLAVPCVTHGGWSAWSKWSVCSNITNTKLRRRSCDNPAPVNGGSNCTGEDVQRKNCSLCPCSVTVRLFPGRKNLTHNTPALFKCSYYSPYNESVNIRMTTTPNIASLLSLHDQTAKPCGAVRRLTIIRITLQTAVLCEVLAKNGTRIGSATFKISLDNGAETTARPIYVRATRSHEKITTMTEETYMDPMAPWENLPGTDVEESGVCDEKEFLCANSMCVPLTLTCDGADDCGDNSDEFACQTHGAGRQMALS